MSPAYIRKEALRLIQRHKTRDPILLAQRIGVHVEYENGFDSLKGMYFIIKRNRFIVINGNLDERLRRVVCAHELGHDRLHKHLAVNAPFNEFSVYDMRRRPEYEANVFASELLISDDDILPLIYEGRSADYIASALNTDANMVLLKTDILRILGHSGIRPPQRPPSDYLGHSQ